MDSGHLPASGTSVGIKGTPTENRRCSRLSGCRHPATAHCARERVSHPMEMARALVSPTVVGAHGSKPLHSLILSPEHVRL